MNATFPKKPKRAAAGVLSLVMISLVITIFFAALITHTNLIETAQRLQDIRAQKIQESIELAQSIQARWRYDPLTSVLQLNITNQHSEPVLIVGAIIVHNDGSYQIWNLNHILSPGETHTHTQTTPSPVAIRITASTTQGASGVIQATNQTTTTTPGPNTWTPGPNLQPPAIPQGAATWQGTAFHIVRQNITSLLNNLQANYGTITGGAPTNIEASDNLNLTLESQTLSTPPQLILKTNNTIIWDHFTTDPIAAGRLVPLVSNEWSYWSHVNKDFPIFGVLPSHWGNSFAYIDFSQYGYATPHIPSYLLSTGFYTVVKMDNFDSFSRLIFASTPTPSCVAPTVTDSLFTGIIIANDYSPSGQYRYPLNYYQIGQCYYKDNSNNYWGSVSIRKGFNANTIQHLASTPLNQNLGPTFTQGEMMLVAYYKLGIMRAEIREWNNVYGPITYIDNQFTPRYLGLSVSGFADHQSSFNNKIYPAARYDFIYVVKERYPLDVYVEAPPGHTVIIYKWNSIINNFIFVESNSTHDSIVNGYRVRIYASFNQGQFFEPVFYGKIELRDSTWTLVGVYTGTLMGGSVYQFIPGSLERVEIEVNFTNPGVGVSGFTTVYPVMEISSNLSTTSIEVLAYNFQTNTFVTVASGTGSLVNASIPLTADFIEPGSNKTRLIINATDSSPFRLEIDLANTILEGVHSQAKETLLVAYDNWVQVYEVDTTASPPGFTHLYTIDFTPLTSLGSLGSVTVVNSTLPPPLSTPVSLVFASTNTSGARAYYVGLDPNAIPQPGAAGTAGLIVEKIEDQSVAPPQEYVLVLSPGTSSTSYYILDTTPGSAGSIVDQGVILGITVWQGYYSSANINGDVYTLAYNTTSSSLELLRLVYQSLGVPSLTVQRIVSGLGFLNPVGMDDDPNGDLVVLAEGGPLYKIDLPSGNVSVVSSLFPFVPQGVGDRLEYVGGVLVFVRGYGSNQVWYLD